MHPLLKPVQLKLDRAAKHAETLQSYSEHWADQNLLTPRTELLPDRMGYDLFAGAITNFEKLDDYGVVLSEFGHMLRSALDNLAFSLARLRNDPPPHPKRISFPIFDDEARFLKDSRSGLDQMATDVADKLTLIQPFQRGKPGTNGAPDADPLILLQKLNNLDKHQIPTVALLMPATLGFQSMVEFFTDEDAAANLPPDVTVNIEPLAPGVRILTHRTKSPLKNAVGNFDFEVKLSIFVEDNWLEILETVEQLNWYTNLVVDEFRPFFK